MGHCLTQPEEIDHILMAMAGDDMEVDTPVQDGVKPSEAIRDVGRDEFSVIAEFSDGAGYKKSVHGLSDP